MQKIRFVDGTQADCLGVHSQQTSYQGLVRDSLIFLFDPSVDPSEAAEAFTPENTARVGIAEDYGSHTGEFWYEGYTIRTGYGKGLKERVLGNYGYVSLDGQEETVTWVQMVQSTAQERMLQSHQEVLDALVMGALNDAEGEEG